MTSKCKNIENYLPAYLDGRLDKAVCEEIAGHLSQCQNCACLLKEIENAENLIASAFADTPKFDIEEQRRRFWKKADEAQNRKLFLFHRGHKLIARFAISLCAIAAISIGFSLGNFYTSAYSDSSENSASQIVITSDSLEHPVEGLSMLNGVLENTESEESSAILASIDNNTLNSTSGEAAER